MSTANMRIAKDLSSIGRISWTLRVKLLPVDPHKLPGCIFDMHAYLTNYNTVKIIWESLCWKQTIEAERTRDTRAAGNFNRLTFSSAFAAGQRDTSLRASACPRRCEGWARDGGAWNDERPKKHLRTSGHDAWLTSCCAESKHRHSPLIIKTSDCKHFCGAQGKLLLQLFCTDEGESNRIRAQSGVKILVLLWYGASFR